MRLPFLNFRNKNTNKFLTIDINSSEVICIAFYIDESRNTRAIGIGRSPLEAGAVRTGIVVDIDQVKIALEAAVTQAEADMEDEINNVIFGVSGEMSLGLTTTAKSTRSVKGPITQEEINKMEQVIYENAFISARNEVLETSGTPDVDLDLITSSTVYTKVNGREVENPMEFEGETIEIAKFTSFTPTFHIKSLEKIARQSGLNIIAIGSEMFSLVKALNNGADYVLINIASDFTDVAVVFGNGIVHNKTMHIGSNHFTKEISQKMGLSMKEAARIRNSYISDSLATSESMIVQSSMQETMEYWLDGLQLLFTEFSGVKTFASQVYVTGEGAKIPDIIDSLTKEPWTKTIPFKTPPEFSVVSLENLKKMVDSTGQIDHPEFIMPASLAQIFLEMQK